MKDKEFAFPERKTIRGSSLVYMMLKIAACIRETGLLLLRTQQKVFRYVLERGLYLITLFIEMKQLKKYIAQS